MNAFRGSMTGLRIFTMPNIKLKQRKTGEENYKPEVERSFKMIQVYIKYINILNYAH